MTLEERIAEVAQRAFDHSPNGDVWQDVARAVVAVLPTADVTLDEITEFVNNRDGLVVESIKALLDTQAAAHAAEVEALRAEVDRLALAHRDVSAAYVSTGRMLDTAEADRDRAVREALENAAQKIEQEQPWPDGAVAIVRSLIPGGTDEHTALTQEDQR